MVYETGIRVQEAFKGGAHECERKKWKRADVNDHALYGRTGSVGMKVAIKTDRIIICRVF